MDRQPRITDLVPRRYRVFALWFVLAAAAIGGLEALYFYMPQMAQHTSDGRIAAFDLDGEGSLGAWFSSVTLGCAGLLALVILSIRRQRADDYHGRYRVWFWAAALFFVMSVDEGGSLHEGFKEMMTGLTGYRLAGDGSLWWVIAYLLVGGVIGVRVLLSLRHCRGAVTCLSLTALCYTASVVVQLEWLLPQLGAQAVMVEEGLEMSGNVFLLLGLGLYARYAILEAQGMIPVVEKVAKPRRVKESSEPAAVPAQKQRAAEPMRSGSQPLASHMGKQGSNSGSSTASTSAKSSGNSPAASAGDARVDSAEGHKPHQRLSKAERRALRRQGQSNRYDDDE